MKKVQLVLILAIFFIHSLFAADHYQPGDILYVWAPSGLNLRSQPNAKGDKLVRLETGAQVEVLEKTDLAHRTLAVASRPQAFPTNVYQQDGSGKAYYLKGHWVKVKAEKWEGYVIDMYLLDKPAPPEKMTLFDYVSWLEKKPMEIDTTFHESCEGGVLCYDFQGRLENGISVQGSTSLTTVEETWQFPGMSIEEGFVMMNLFQPLEDGLRKKTEETLLMRIEYADYDWDEETKGEYLSFLSDDLCSIDFFIRDGILHIGEGCSC
ncbi:MAG: SH3 domain-containing protein [Bacteroidota bacterium]